MRKPDENLVREISRRRCEPEWLLDIRLDALAKWRKMSEPHWSDVDYEPIDYDSLNYFNSPAMIDNSDLADAYKKMGLPESEQKALLGMATDTVIDSKSVHTSYTEELNKLGIIFLPFSEAARKHSDLLKKYMGTVVSPDDNFFASLNTAAFSDGTFVYVPRGVKCPIDLASYFRIETANIGQFERTLIIADEGAELSYMEGCSAPRRPNHQLHGGVVEVIAKDGALVKYATVQNWATNIYNFVTKRATVGKNAKMYWTQMEIGSAKTWKYPSSILAGENAFSDFYSLSITRGTQQADTGTKMIHMADGTKSNIVNFGVAAGNSRQTFRSLVRFAANNCANASVCDSKIIGDSASANTIPAFVSNADGNYSHEAKTGALDKYAMHYLASAGINEEEAAALLVAGMAAPVLSRLPMEFLAESRQLIQMAMEK
ncbi:MAG: Fe-S cluster assembly protein SufB [Rickettsiales bacterium]|jgi:Fe-S cluster assembly protein SufB|nr:Fe-S cluster assembly protein SufB [Rickettsiales bacterium]